MLDVTDTPANPQPVVHHPAGAVSAIRAARRWPVFEASKRTNFWINTLLTIVALAASYGAALAGRTCRTHFRRMSPAGGGLLSGH